MADDAQKLAPHHIHMKTLHGAALKGRSRTVGMGQIFDLNDRFQRFLLLLLCAEYPEELVGTFLHRQRLQRQQHAALI